MERDADKIGRVLSKEISKGLKSAIGEVVRTAEIIHYAAEEGLRLEGEVLEGGAFDAGSKKKIAVVRREPVGLVLAISPFNYPVNLAGSKIAPSNHQHKVLSQVFFWLKHLLKLVSLLVS